MEIRGYSIHMVTHIRGTVFMHCCNRIEAMKEEFDAFTEQIDNEGNKVLNSEVMETIFLTRK